MLAGLQEMEESVHKDLCMLQCEVCGEGFDPDSELADERQQATPIGE